VYLTILITQVLHVISCFPITTYLAVDKKNKMLQAFVLLIEGVLLLAFSIIGHENTVETVITSLLREITIFTIVLYS